MESMIVKLGKVCDIVSGTTPKSGIAEYWDGGLPWVTPADLDEDSHIINDTQRTLTEEGVASKKLPLLPKGTVLLSSRAPIGKVAIAGCEMYCNQGFKNLVCSDSVYNEYLYCFLKSRTEWLQHLGKGATFKELSKTALSDVEMPLPTLEKQHEIVDRLGLITRQIELVKRMLAKTDELMQSRFMEMFDDSSRERVALADVCDFYSGGTPSKRKPEYWNGTLPWFSPKDMKRPVLDDSIDHISDVVVEQTSLRLLPSDTVVIVVRGMILAHDVPVSIITVPATINQDMKALIPKPGKECDSVYLAAAIRSQENYLLAETGSSAHGTKKIDAIVLGTVSIPEADIHEQREFAAFVQQVESMKTDLNQQLDRLNTLYDSLTQRYFA
ncbi:hypothetical protein CPA40_07075 [Bifidobacterium callitrichos]|uniref:Type I restriction modification DNA specificity domain-containing protein n=1 Tax=Bifidobacterium callitrichos TaxID=762209 RepID=A0A2T3G9L9_9BIFI|nr:restriction endonuclease subunit S [Bifidobacterium callitrichos]PST46195.1 hypothetical protein CPA40_07075 [Bifidobacterium callitrichos]